MKETLLINETPVHFETGKWAQQANSSVTVRSGKAVILITAVAANSPSLHLNFFPLTVEYREKFAANGMIPGSYGRREARPSTNEILTSRLIDRSIRPLFTKGYKNETQIMISVYSADEEVDLPALAITGTSLALMLSDIPWEGPISGVRIGKTNGTVTTFPNPVAQKDSELDIVVSIGDSGILMVEGESREIEEAEWIKGLQQSLQIAPEIQKFQTDWQKKAGLEKMVVIVEDNLSAEIRKQLEHFAPEARKAMQNPVKKIRQKAVKETTKNILEAILTEDSNDAVKKEAKEAVNKLFKHEGRKLILEGKRFDNRKTTEIRPLEHEVGVLPSSHGSAIFTRGETQSLTSCTLGNTRSSLREDSLYGTEDHKFFLHYNFPSFSVGEVRPIRSPGRREIGHGNLAARALSKIIPEYEQFPYVIRVVSDILASNGSSSMATVCAGCLAMLDAGVPLKSSVAGIAMGLIKEGDQIAILTDILGDEDHLGDMDFKVCGTIKGITAIQMDLKMDGLTEELLTQALEQARQARLYLLKSMAKTRSAPRPSVAQNAQKNSTMKIRANRIGDLIGPGGRFIKGIKKSTGADVDVNDDGLVIISALDPKALKNARQQIKQLTAEPQVDAVYPGTVTRIFQSFVIMEILPGIDGTMHISEISQEKIGRIEDVLQVGDKCMIKVLGVDDRGRIKVSRRRAITQKQE